MDMWALSRLMTAVIHYDGVTATPACGRTDTGIIAIGRYHWRLAWIAAPASTNVAATSVPDVTISHQDAIWPWVVSS